MAKVNWNQGEYNASGDFPIVPKGRYLAIVHTSQEKLTRNKQGSYFEFEFNVVRPDEFKGRKLWSRLNINNPSDTAQRIGREQFNALCLAAGVEKVDDTARLHGKPIVLIVNIEKTTDGTDREVNTIAGYQKPTGNDAAAAAKAGAGKGAQRASGGGSGTQKRDPAPADAKKGEQAPPPDDDIPF